MVKCFACDVKIDGYDDEENEEVSAEDCYDEEPCENCTEIFEKIFDIIYGNDEFQWGIHKRKPDGDYDDDEQMVWDFILLPAGSRWLEEQFQKSFKNYKPKDFQAYAENCYICFR